ncbi:MAG TPA: hypothetical protein VG605_15680 [Puia sp.]|nr:hypothetical protein [Puia sp.]
MNWKPGSYLTIVVVLASVLCACKKNSVFAGNEQAQVDSAVNVQGNDQVRITSELDAVFNDINTVMTSESTIIGARSRPVVRHGVTVAGGPVDTVQTPVCGAMVTVDVADTPNVIAINYAGNSCDNSRYRLGTVNIYFNPGTVWSTANTTVGVNFVNVAFARYKDSAIVYIKGPFYLTNVSGGSLASLSSGAASSIVHSIIGVNIGITYSDASVATWQVSRLRTYTYNNGLVVSTTGMDSAGGVAHVTEFGGTRYGNSFITSTNTPLVMTQACDFQVTGGQALLTNPSGTTSMLFGLDSTGKAAGCPSAGNTYFYQLSWTGTGANPYSAILPYY